jgi:serine/threonine protein kinase
MRSTSSGATPFDAASAPVRLTYLEEAYLEERPRDGWARSGALLAQRYELEEQNAESAPGNLWRARQLRSRRPVTVQLLDPAIVEDAVLMEAFLHEASLAAAIDHPHVARVLDYGIDYDLDGGVPFLVLEHLGGETLERHLARRPRLSPPELARVLTHAALGLEALHERGLVHCRLDPSRLILSDDFRSGSFQAGTFSTDGFCVDSLEMQGATTQLLFALDEAFRESLCLVHKLSHQLAWPRAVSSGVVSSSVVSSSVVSSSVVSSGAVPGSAPASGRRERSVRSDAGEYQSPEQLLGHGPVDARSDLWSLAVIAFEALTGIPAFSGATLGERLVRVCSGEPNTAPADLALPPGFNAWFEQGVRKLPSERFASAREMSDAFVRLLDT